MLQPRSQGTFKQISLLYEPKHLSAAMSSRLVMRLVLASSSVVSGFTFVAKPHHARVPTFQATLLCTSMLKLGRGLAPQWLSATWHLLFRPKSTIGTKGSSPLWQCVGWPHHRVISLIVCALLARRPFSIYPLLQRPCCSGIYSTFLDSARCRFLAPTFAHLSRSLPQLLIV